MANQNRQKELAYTATLNIADLAKGSKEAIELFKKMRAEAAVTLKLNTSVDTRPLTAFQAEQLKIKQQTIDLAKAKQDADRTDKQASLERMQAISEEVLARQQINTQISANKLAQQQANAAAM